MPDESDQKLVSAYARDRSEAAFDELVHRHVDLVYSTALRIVCNGSLAEEVTQRVFLALAQHSAKLQDRSALSGWLHETARNYAVSTVRSEERRRQREQEVAAMQDLQRNDSETLWKQIAPQLDEALAELSDPERNVILWRYFERLTSEQIGRRLGLTAEAAQKRVTRALDRLRGVFAARGLVASAASLPALLSTQAVQSAPVGLAAATISAANAANTILTASSTLQLIMTSLKAKIGIAALLAACVTTPLVLEHVKNSRLLDELTLLRQQGSEVDRLRGEVQRLNDEARSSSTQGETDRAEIGRLRSELSALKVRNAETASAARNAKPAGRSGQTDATPESDKPLVRAEELSNVGFATPSATLKTLEWAKAKQSTNVIANALAWADEQSRAQIKAIFDAAPEHVRARYGSADAYVLSLFEWTAPLDDRHRLDAYRILDETIVGDEATLQLEFHFGDGSTYTAPMRYVRIGNEWRQALDFDAPSQGKLSASLQQEPQTP